jgi:mannosyltransferase
VVLPLIMLAVGVGLGVVRARLARFLLFGGLMFFGLAGVLIELSEERTQAGVVAATVVAEGIGPGDVVAYCPDQLGPGGERALRQLLGAEAVAEITQVAVPDLGDPRFVNWVDYADRNAAIDPAAVVNDLRQLGGGDGTIFLVWFGGYRTWGGTCEQIRDGLSAAYPDHAQILDAEVDDHFEPAAVTVYRP